MHGVRLHLEVTCALVPQEFSVVRSGIKTCFKQCGFKYKCDHYSTSLHEYLGGPVIRT